METTETARTLTWQVNGMHCPSCTILIDEAVEGLDGVASSTTSLNKKITTVTFDPNRCAADLIESTIAEAGYQATSAVVGESTGRRPWFRRTGP